MGILTSCGYPVGWGRCSLITRADEYAGGLVDGSRRAFWRGPPEKTNDRDSRGSRARPIESKNFEGLKNSLT